MTKNEFLDRIVELTHQAEAAGQSEANAADRRGESDMQVNLSATAAMRFTYMSNMPVMSTRREVQLYLACVAHGFGKGFLTSQDMRACTYAAQLALAAFSGTAPDPEPPRPRAKASFTGRTN